MSNSGASDNRSQMFVLEDLYMVQMNLYQWGGRISSHPTLSPETPSQSERCKRRSMKAVVLMATPCTVKGAKLASVNVVIVQNRFSVRR